MGVIVKMGSEAITRLLETQERSPHAELEGLHIKEALLHHYFPRTDNISPKKSGMPTPEKKLASLVYMSSLGNPMSIDLSQTASSAQELVAVLEFDKTYANLNVRRRTKIDRRDNIPTSLRKAKKLHHGQEKARELFGLNKRLDQLVGDMGTKVKTERIVDFLRIKKQTLEYEKDKSDYEVEELLEWSEKTSLRGLRVIREKTEQEYSSVYPELERAYIEFTQGTFLSREKKDRLKRIKSKTEELSLLLKTARHPKRKKAQELASKVEQEISLHDTFLKNKGPSEQKLKEIRDYKEYVLSLNMKPTASIHKKSNRLLDIIQEVESCTNRIKTQRANKYFSPLIAQSEHHTNELYIALKYELPEAINALSSYTEKSEKTNKRLERIPFVRYIARASFKRKVTQAQTTKKTLARISSFLERKLKGGLV